VFRYYAGGPERLLGDTIPVAGGQAFTVREPLGVVGLITPWNFPLPIASWKLGPALAAGNTVVLKPAELTPLSALRLAERALAAAPGAVFGNAGQDCCARSRILVQRSCLDQFMDALEEHVEAMRVGDPLDESTDMGPLISAQQRETVASYVSGDAPIAIR